MRVSPKAPFNWKLLLIGIFSVKGIIKNVPILKVSGSAPAPLTTPVIMVVLFHTEEGRETFFRVSVDSIQPRLLADSRLRTKPSFLPHLIV